VLFSRSWCPRVTQMACSAAPTPALYAAPCWLCASCCNVQVKLMQNAARVREGWAMAEGGQIGCAEGGEERRTGSCREMAAGRVGMGGGSRGEASRQIV